MDAPNGDGAQRRDRRPLEHVEGLPGSSLAVVLFVRLLLRSVALGSRATMNVASYLDTLVERVAETYLQTGVNLLGDAIPTNADGANPIIDAPPPPPVPPAEANQVQIPPPPPIPAIVAHPPHYLAHAALQVHPAPVNILVHPPPPAVDPPAQIADAGNAAQPLPPAYGDVEDAPPDAIAVAAPAAPGLGDQHLGTHYYAVFVGRQVGVFDNWCVYVSPVVCRELTSF